MPEIECSDNNNYSTLDFSGYNPNIVQLWIPIIEVHSSKDDNSKILGYLTLSLKTEDPNLKEVLNSRNAEKILVYLIIKVLIIKEFREKLLNFGDLNQLGVKIYGQSFLKEDILDGKTTEAIEEILRFNPLSIDGNFGHKLN